MKLKDAIVPACALVITIAVLWRIAKEDPVFSEDEGKEERDSLRIDARARGQEAAKWMARADSAAAWHDRELSTALPVETLYMQAHEEALSLPVAVKWAYMGQLPDTAIAR